MSFHFYLSHSPADCSETLQAFFEDLSCMVRASLGLSKKEQVGFFEPRGIAVGPEWCAGGTEALRTSQMMVALVSPEYIQSEHAGKEWQFFETRRYLGARGGLNEAKRVVPRVIAPVIWLPCDGQMPRVISDAHCALGDSNGVYGQNGLLMVLKSADRFHQEYAKVLTALTEQIVGMARNAKLPPLDAVPPLGEVDNAFKYKAIIVEGHQQVREMLIEYLSVSGFKVEGYAKAELVPPEILKHNPQMPDLFVVDLEFETNEPGGLNLIGKIKDSEVRSAIMAMSASLSNGNLVEAMKMGAEYVVAKPFHVVEIVERMKNLAHIGRNRRLSPQGRFPSDSKDESRSKRPVFLSYSGLDNKDKGVAAFLRSNIEARGIGVWYADDNAVPEDSDAAESILKAIDEAQVYLPLLTHSYPSSKYCLAELVRFYSRLGIDGSRILLPVLHDSPKTMPHFNWIKPIIDEHQFADLSSECFLDGLIALLGWIQKSVNGKFQIPAKFKE